MTTQDDPDRRNKRALHQPDKTIATAHGPRRFVTVAKAALLSGYSQGHISNLHHIGLIARRREGRYLYVCLDDLQAHLSRQAQIIMKRAAERQVKAASRKGERS